jgi:hypothetical protein
LQEEKRFYEIDWDLMTLSTHWKMQKFNMDFEIIISFLGSSSQFKVPENDVWGWTSKLLLTTPTCFLLKDL